MSQSQSTGNTPPLHRMYHHYSEMPYSQRILFTATLLLFGFGYLFALANIYNTYAGRAGGNPLMLSYRDIVVGYSGSGQGSVLEGALGGPMRNMLPTEERATILNWLHSGTKPEVFQADVQPIIAKRCFTCHDGTNPHIPNLSSSDGIKQVTAADTGPPVARLVMVSHIHLFGMAFIFFIMGFMFSHAYVRPVWLKCTIIALPFLAIASDISSWYLVRLFHPFAMAVIGGGMAMAACFAFMWVVTIYQMWFSTPPRAVQEREGHDLPIR